MIVLLLRKLGEGERLGRFGFEYGSGGKGFDVLEEGVVVRGDENGWKGCEREERERWKVDRWKERRD